MATLPELETALRNADKAGDMNAARQLAAAVMQARGESANQIPGAQIPGTQAEPAPRTLLDRIKGLGETGLTLATGATTGTLGALGGVAKTIGQNVLYGASDGLEKNVVSGMQAGTYLPKTEAGQEYVGDIGQLASNLPPVIPQVAGLNAIGQAARQQAPLMGAMAQRAGQAVAAPVGRAVQAGREMVGMDSQTPSGGMRSGGAAATPAELQRRTVAESMPVPFTGESALTKGQATRDFDQLKFEKETAKQGDLGQPLRERTENQAATMLQNFDAMVNDLNPISLDKRDIGRGVNQAIVNKANIAKNQIRTAYQKARDAGEMVAPVEMTQLAPVLDDLIRYEGLAENVGPIKKEAIRLGAVVPDADGKLIPQAISLDDSELLRQFVNKGTNWADKRQSLMAKDIVEAIDASTEGQGGELYRGARKLRHQYAQEFQNVGLTNKLLSTKRGTDERQIAFDDVFDQVIGKSSLEEMNKLRRTLLTAGPDGKQAWTDLKAKSLDAIKEGALSASQRDSRGNPLMSVDKLNRNIKRMDEEGKLESLYGKKQAQTIRDLGELAKDIHTAPPGAINHSNTASALQVALDSMATMTLTGIPAPAVTALREASKYVKNRKVKTRINEALNTKKANP